MWCLRAARRSILWFLLLHAGQMGESHETGHQHVQVIFHSKIKRNKEPYFIWVEITHTLYLHIVFIILPLTHADVNEKYFFHPPHRTVCLSSHTFKYIIFIKQYKNTTYIVMFNGRENWLNLLKIYIEKKKKFHATFSPLILGWNVTWTFLVRFTHSHFANI